MQKVLFFLLMIFMVGCGRSRGHMKIGIDNKWYPLDFGTQTIYVNGYVEDLLLEMAKYTGMEFERIPANWDNLWDGLKQKKYDAVFSSLPPYEYNKAQYDFSSAFLNLGPVLITSIQDRKIGLTNMKGQVIGIVSGDPAVVILEKNPVILIRSYPTIPDMLNAVVLEEIDGALLDWIPAVNYVGDLYAGRLKIVGEPLTDAGLRLVSLKRNNHWVQFFNKNLDALIKQKKLKVFQKKWLLAFPE